MDAEERQQNAEAKVTGEVPREEVKVPHCAAVTDKTVTLHKECFEGLMGMYLAVTLERNLYLAALQGIVKDYETIGYQTDCILAMWSKAKRALDGGISTKREPGGDGTDLGGGVRT